MTHAVNHVQRCRYHPASLLYPRACPAKHGKPYDCNRSLALAEQLKTMGVSCTATTSWRPFPGTEVQGKQPGLRPPASMSHDWDDYHANQAIVRTSAVDQQTLDGIVKDWQKNFDTWLDDIKQRRDNGEATEEEAWPLTNLEHIVLIYDLMMKQVLETIEWIPLENTDATDKNELAHLADLVDGTIPHTPEQIHKTLQFAIVKGYLTKDIQEGCYRWKWINYL